MLVIVGQWGCIPMVTHTHALKNQADKKSLMTISLESRPQALWQRGKKEPGIHCLQMHLISLTFQGFRIALMHVHIVRNHLECIMYGYIHVGAKSRPYDKDEGRLHHVHVLCLYLHASTNISTLVVY